MARGTVVYLKNLSSDEFRKNRKFAQDKKTGAEKKYKLNKIDLIHSVQKETFIY
jgi:hypothetical protein